MTITAQLAIINSRHLTLQEIAITDVKQNNLSYFHKAVSDGFVWYFKKQFLSLLKHKQTLHFMQ